MKFWDTSAILPLLVSEPTTQGLLSLLRDDPVMVVWWGTPVECTSAVARLERAATITSAEAARALSRLRAIADEWQEVLPVGTVRAVAQRLLRVHPLRAADALQLGAAIVAAEHEPASLEIVCLDARLAEAAQREGFTVVQP